MKKILKVFILTLIFGCGVKQKKIEVIPSSQVFPQEEKRDYKGIYHKVEKGETLYKISKLYGVSVSEIVKFNKIKEPSLIKEGQLIYIPGGGYKMGEGKEDNFIWPLEGKVISNYRDPTSRGENRGIDILSASNTVRAVASGVVCYAGEDIKGYGKVIIIDHGNKLYTLYAYNSQLLVKKNDRVKQGEAIALLSPEKPVLHFEVRKGHRSLDPLNFLK